MNNNYYAGKLNAHKLYQVYDTNLPRVKQYLDAEIDFVRKKLHNDERVLELGAGYGRIMKDLAGNAKKIIGIDISKDNVEYGKEYLKYTPNTELIVMDAHKLDLNESFDVILCMQNALSAMKSEPFALVDNLLKVLSERGRLYFSTYSNKFWQNRLEWFFEQSEKGLLGEIDIEKTKNGIIVCKDGFIAKTSTEEDFEKIGEYVGLPYELTEVDNSSLFLTIHK